MLENGRAETIGSYASVSSRNGLIIVTDVSEAELDGLHREWYSVLKDQEPNAVVLAVTAPSPEGHRSGVYINLDPRFAEYLRARGYKFTVIE